MRSASSRPRASQYRTQEPATSWASRKGSPWRTSHSAMSVASAKPSGAAAAMRSVSNRSVCTIPVTAGSTSSSVSTASKTGSLSSCRSRLYANGRPLRVASNPVRWPISRPALPRASSATSGFFFCGMIDEPVEYASSSAAQPNSREAHRQTSSPIRERWTPIIAAAKRNSAAKSRSDTASMELAIAPSNPSSAAVASGSSGSDEPASAPAPERRVRRAGVPVAQPLDVAGEGVGVLGQLVAERHRLGVLQVGEAGGGGVDVALGLVDERLLQIGQGEDHAAGLGAQVEPEVGRHLVVAAAPGAELAAERAEPLDQAALQRGVHVLVGRRRREVPAGDVALEPVEGLHHLRELVVVQQPGPVQDAGVGPRRGQVVRRQPPVEVHRQGQRGQRVGRPALEPATPQPQRAGLLGHVSPSAGRGPRPAGWAGPTAARSPWPGTGRRCRRCRTWPG